MELDFSVDTIEKLLFKQILSDKTYLNILSTAFDKRWIKTNHLGRVMQLCIAFFKKYEKVPDAKIAKALVKKYLEKHSEIDKQTGEEYYKTIDDALSLNLDLPKDILSTNLKNYIKKQALWISILDNVDDLEKNSENVLDKCIARFDQVNKLVFDDQDLGLDYFSEEGMKSHWEYMTKPDNRIPFLWPGLDYLTNGGSFRDGRMLGVIMGQAGLGKSLFLSNIALNFLKQNLKVVVISLEMSENVYAQRFDAHISEDNINKLKDTAESSIEKIKKFYAEHPDANLRIKEYSPKSVTAKDIFIYLENLKTQGFKFDVVILDYLNLLLPTKSYDNMYKDVLTVTEQIRGLSYYFECPFWSATQANTDGMNNENIDIQHVSESRGIVHTVDFLSGLFQMPEDRENGILNMRILKNRLGGNIGKVCIFKMNSENLLLTDISYDPDRDDFNFSSEANNVFKNVKNMSDELEEL